MSHHEQVVARIVTDRDWFEWNVTRGDVSGQIYIQPDGKAFAYLCPCGCSEARHLPLKPVGIEGRGWMWDGNREAPTVAPSIRHVDGCRWHGFLEHGIWKPCRDSGQ